MSDDSVHNQLSEASFSISRLVHDPNLICFGFLFVVFFSTELLPFYIQTILESKLPENLKETAFNGLSDWNALKKIWKKFCLVEDLKVNITTYKNLHKKPNVLFFCTELDLHYLTTRT